MYSKQSKYKLYKGRLQFVFIFNQSKFHFTLCASGSQPGNLFRTFQTFLWLFLFLLWIAGKFKILQLTWSKPKDVISYCCFSLRDHKPKRLGTTALCNASQSKKVIFKFYGMHLLLFPSQNYVLVVNDSFLCTSNSLPKEGAVWYQEKLKWEKVC